MELWGDTVKSARQSAADAVDELDEIITWFNRDVMDSGAFSRKTLSGVSVSLTLLSESIAQLAHAINKVADAQSHATLTFLAGKN
jgi:hypothetical protein